MIQVLAASFIGVYIYRLGSLAWQLVLRFGSVAKQRSLFPSASELSLDLRCDIKYPTNVRIGAHVIIGAECQIGAMAAVVLEDHVRISRGVIIETASLDLAAPLPYPHQARPILIGRGVWLGAYSMVLGGVTIGEGAVIGAGAVVTKDVPPWTVVVGCSPRLFPRSGGHTSAQT